MAATSPDARAPVHFDDVAVGDRFESPEGARHRGVEPE